MVHRGDGMTQNQKWAEKLSSQCGVSSAFLKNVMEELSESCFGDAKTSKEVIEELTLSCHLNEEELRRFISDVSKNCPVDVKKLKKEVIKAEGNKANLFETWRSEGSRWVQDRSSVR
jgi:hypothetical protein